jgi:hypothetical protein
MEEVDQDASCRLQIMGLSQDRIGWRRFLQGMISKETIAKQQHSYALDGSRLSLEEWSSRLTTRLLEITHGQWLYKNYKVHDLISGTIELQGRKICYWKLRSSTTWRRWLTGGG